MEAKWYIITEGREIDIGSVTKSWVSNIYHCLEKAAGFLKLLFSILQPCQCVVSTFFRGAYIGSLDHLCGEESKERVGIVC